MEKYNYYEAVKDNVSEYVWMNKDAFDWDNLDEVAEELFNILWVSDDVTGNGSGSYTFSTWKAEEYLCHNLDLLGEALKEFDCGVDYLINNGAEACDVTIRCYLLNNAISEVIQEVVNEIE